MEEHEEHEEETRTIRPRSISVYGKNGKASYVGDIEIPKIENDNIDSLMALVNRNSTGQPLKEKKDTETQISEEKAKQMKKSFEEKYSSMKNQVEEGVYNPLKTRRRKMSLSEGDPDQALQSPNIEFQQEDKEGTNADSGLDVNKYQQALPTKKGIQKLKDKLKAKSTRLKDGETDIVESPQKPEIETGSHELLPPKLPPRKQKSDDSLPSLQLNQGPINTPTAKLPPLNLGQSSIFSAKNKGPFGSQNLKKQPLSRSSSLEEEPKIISTRSRSLSSASRFERPAQEEKKTKMRIETNMALFEKESEQSPDIVLTNSDYFLLKENQPDFLSSVNDQYIELLKEGNKILVNKQEFKLLTDSFEVMEGNLLKTLDYLVTITAEASEIKLGCAKIQYEQEKATKGINKLHEQLGKEGVQLGKTLEELSMMQEVIGRVSVGSQSESKIQQFLWTLLAFFLASIATIIWASILLFRLIKLPFTYFFGRTSKTPSVNPVTASNTLLFNDSNFETTISTNPEVWRKRLKTYFETPITNNI